MMWTTGQQSAIRQDIFRWLERQEIDLGGYEFRRDFLRTAYAYGDQTVPLMDRQNGIWNPKGFDSTLSITQTLKGPYTDQSDGALQQYSYERLPNRPLVSGRNIKLRAAAANGDPLIMFQEILPSLYIPRYPVFIIHDDPVAGYVWVTLDESFRQYHDPLAEFGDLRRYAEQVTKVRLHQKSFRSRILHAYESKCAVCRLEKSALLDAAHITPDGDADSSTSVTNGIALCKIHHAAYDRRILAIDGDYRIHLRRDFLSATDNPMLLHGMQRVAGTTIAVPPRKADQPDRERLHLRFLEFAP